MICGNQHSGRGMGYPSGAGVPDRGRVVIVHFELGGGFIEPKMCKSGRPCVVVQNNKLARGPLVTVVPLSTTAPARPMPYHHLMDHRSFTMMPSDYGGQGLQRWAKCDHLMTVSLARCADPYSRRRYRESRKYVKVKIIQADMDAIERCVVWATGIQPERHRTAAIDQLLTGPQTGP
jgi:uncharacterized protein YifN (PemK superfamily)